MLKKEFEDTDWLKLIRTIKLYVEEYNLEIISIDLTKTNDVKYKYKAIVQFGLGLR